jgi:hypothetical protein
MPETTSVGRAAFIRWFTATYTQSAGVPSIENCRSATCRIRKGSCSDNECDVALCSWSGATTHVSARGSIAFTSASSPFA